MEASPEPASSPLLRYYDDRAVLMLEPLHDAFIARDLEQRRLSKTQEEEWTARIAKDVQRDERATKVVESWLRATSLSDRREFCNFAPQLTYEIFQLFVRFFWFIKIRDRRKATELLTDTRQKWGLEPQFHKDTANKVMEDPSYASPSSLYWTRHPTGQVHGFKVGTGKSVKGKAAKSRKTSKSMKRKRDVNRPFSSAITKRLAITQLSFKKRRKFKANTRLGQRTTVNKDSDRLELSSNLGGITRRSKRKGGHHDDKSPGPRERIQPGRSKIPTAKANNRKLGRFQRVPRPIVEHSDVSHAPKLFRNFTPRPNEPVNAAGNVPPVDLRGHTRRNKRASLLPKVPRSVVASHVNLGDSLVPEASMLSHSIPDSTTWPQTSPVGVTGRASETANVTGTNSARRRRASAPSVPFTDQSQAPANISGPEAITELNASEINVSGGHSSLPFAFDDVVAEAAEDEDDLYDDALNEYPDISSIGLEQEQHVTAQPRPPPPITPPIWAQSRQEVCESLDSFRSFQGGVYHSNDIVKGYLLGAHSSSRDLFHHGGKLIISHGGGKSEALHMKNRRLEIQGPADQLEDDRSVRALLNNYRSGRPLVLLADSNYVLFPFDLAANGYTYVVLGLYWIAHAWAELQRVDENHPVVRYKFAFQWCEGQGDPWWLSGTEEVPVVTRTHNSQVRDCDGEHRTSTPEGQNNLTSTNGCQEPQSQMTTYLCQRCRLSSPLVYQDAPMCLQPRCAAFCRIDRATLDSSSPPQTLSYSTELLRLRPANHQPVSADSLYPPLPTAGSTTPRPFAKGMHCKDCGRLSTRFKWEHYECSHCHRVYEAPRFVFSHKDFWLQEQNLKFYQHRVAEDSGIVVRGLEFRPRASGSALPYVQTFDLPHNRGRVHLIPGHPSINVEANALFRDYQRQAACGEIQFRRWPLRAHKCRGQLLSNYFSQNTGAPYQYIGGAERTTPLEGGAKAVLGALALIKHRIATALGKDVPFNEVLSAAYMEKQKMAFHSDSERGLGPIVASLSLGSTAEMHFRLHAKYTVTEGHRKVAMSILLRHGDVLVMEGAGVQEYYEHTVVPKNFRIVATARFISPENYTTGV